MDIKDFKAVTIALPEEFADILQKIGDLRGQTVNGFVVNLIISFLKQNQLIDSSEYPSNADIVRLSEVFLAMQDGTIVQSKHQESLQNEVKVEEKVSHSVSDDSKNPQIKTQDNKSNSRFKSTIEELKNKVNSMSVDSPVQHNVKDDSFDNQEAQEEVTEEVSSNTEEEETNTDIAEGNETERIDFIKIAERIESLRGLGNNIQDIIEILDQLGLPTESNAAILTSQKMVSEILTRYRINPNSVISIIDAINRGEMSVSDAYDIVIQQPIDDEQQDMRVEEVSTRVRENVVDRKIMPGSKIQDTEDVGNDNNGNEEVVVQEEELDNTEEDIEIPEPEVTRATYVHNDNTYEERREDRRIGEDSRLTKKSVKVEEQEEQDTAEEESDESNESVEDNSSYDESNQEQNSGYNILRRAMENLNLPKK